MSQVLANFPLDCDKVYQQLNKVIDTTNVNISEALI